MTINPFNTILIFDWDDTLFPTSWLQSNEIRQGNITKDVAIQLEDLDNICIQFLKHAQNLGRIVIVTNSINDWVKISSKLFMTRVHDFISEIDVISARSKFRNLPIKECKVQTFKELIDDDILNILSFGDTSNDRDALFLATKDQTGIYSKSVKFLQTPTIDELKTQLILLTDSIDKLWENNKNLDLVLAIKKE
tara:strand:+ start:1702 stop:2283 length:582 start_codon:yes stop_codon:yes gene_type:complete